jgi:uncharacterized ferritin-like protein (DUF455 family)
MDGTAFVHELDAFKAERLSRIVGAGQTPLLGGAPGDVTRMLQVALANEINVSELAATWMPSTPEVDVKIALARQAGDEAGHFELVADRLGALGFELASFRAPGPNPLFDYLRSLSTTVDRVAAGLFTLESIAYAVNENFMAFCEQHGDAETARIYREYIQPDERAHQQLGRQLLVKYATELASQQRVKEVAAKVIEIASAARAQAVERMGTTCLPGC